jgi:hypothetical protein
VLNDPIAPSRLVVGNHQGNHQPIRPTSATRCKNDDASALRAFQAHPIDESKDKFKISRGLHDSWGVQESGHGQPTQKIQPLSLEQTLREGIRVSDMSGATPTSNG